MRRLKGSSGVVGAPVALLALRRACSPASTCGLLALARNHELDAATGLQRRLRAVAVLGDRGDQRLRRNSTSFDLSSKLSAWYADFAVSASPKCRLIASEIVLAEPS